MRTEPVRSTWGISRSFLRTRTSKLWIKMAPRRSARPAGPLRRSTRPNNNRYATQVMGRATPVKEPPMMAMGWTTRKIVMTQNPTAHFHSLLQELMKEHYADKNYELEYVCEKESHPLKATRWKCKLYVKGPPDDSYDFDHPAPRFNSLDAMEDAAENAFHYYFGLRYASHALHQTTYKYLPYQDDKGQMTMTAPNPDDAVLDIMSEHIREFQIRYIRFEADMANRHVEIRDLEEEVDAHRAALGLPPRYAK